MIFIITYEFYHYNRKQNKCCRKIKIEAPNKLLARIKFRSIANKHIRDTKKKHFGKYYRRSNRIFNKPKKVLRRAFIEYLNEDEKTYAELLIQWRIMDESGFPSIKYF